MRFNYDPESGILSMYVKRDEFALAASTDSKHQDEYRVFARDFSQVAVQSFVEEFTAFTQHIFNSIFPEEKLRDIIALSTYNGGYTWTSLLKLEYQDKAQSFMSNLLSYSLHTLQQQNAKNKTAFIENLTPEDSAKLNLVIGLLNSMNHQQPWQRKKTKLADPQVELNNKMKTLNKKIKLLETKYKFTTEEMLKYYNDDALPEVDFSHWIKYNEELKAYKLYNSKSKLLKHIVNLWMNPSSINDVQTN